MKVTRYDNQTISQIEYFDILINKLSIETLIHGHCIVTDEWVHDQVTSPFHRLYFILDGEGVVRNGNEEVLLEPGRIYLIPANSTWSYYCPNRMEQFFVHIRVLLMKGVDLLDRNNECMFIDIPQSEIDRMIDLVESGTLSSIVSFKGYLFEILSAIIKKYRIDVKSQIDRMKKYESLFSYIHNNCNAELRVSDVVDYSSSSQSSLYRNIMEDTGLSIKNYIDKTLLAICQEYLLITDLSVKEISHKMRFKDQYYFSRFFKKQTGMAPTEYRKLNKITI